MIGRVWEALRREGMGLISSRLGRVARKAIGRQRLVVFRMPAGSESIGPRHEIVEFDAGSLPKHRVPWADTDLDMRFGSGARLFALRVERQPTSFAWISEQPRFRVDEIACELLCDRPLIWIWDCVTPPEYRGRGYYPELIAGLAASLGPSRATIFVRTDNAPSLRGIAKAGFQPWMEIAVTRWSTHIDQKGSFEGRLSLSNYQTGRRA